ncbi:MAG: 4-hydroxythreonine-4-phosphate dehydrogenase PdxA [Parasporobacterium sp.]|nr:4-hydroxythreonine-4-phosphate dehydrogenase PdxA [Parasporobacterium sp.]
MKQAENNKGAVIDRRPVIVVPMGDPAGVGPEIVLKAARSTEVAERCRYLVIGDLRVLERALTFPDMPEVMLHPVADPEEGDYRTGILNVLHLENIDPAEYALGTVNAACGRAAYEYIEMAVRLAMEGQADAVSTTPINKESLHAANVPYIGHTEIFAALTNTPDPLTIFEVRNILVFFLTRHMSLRNACDAITKERLEDYVKRSMEVMQQLGIGRIKMAVAGLNPHCGEHGLFGDEEMREIIPAIRELQRDGYPVEGPVGADSVFFQALEGRYNSVMSLYHDQGHIATKTVDFYRTISITGGMPILRTSVDHGTAFDIAGKGTATSISLEEAILVAAKYAPNFRGTSLRIPPKSRIIETRTIRSE